MKRCKYFIICVLSILLYTTFAFAGQWVQLGENWQYIDDNGLPVVSSWKLLKVGEAYTVYYFDENGNMCTGLKKIDNEIYAFNDNGTPISNTKIMIDDEEYETKAKGLVEGISLNYDIDAYNARMKEEKKAIEESKAAAEAERKRIEESIANRSPEELAMIAASEAAEQARLEAIAAAEEAARQERINNTITSSGTKPSSVSIENEGGVKLTVTFLVPILKGGNADVINQVLEDKMKKEIISLYEDKAEHISKKTTVKVKYVQVLHDLDNHLLRINFSNSEGWKMFTLYLDTATLNMWSDY